MSPPGWFNTWYGSRIAKFHRRQREVKVEPGHGSGRVVDAEDGSPDRRSLMGIALVGAAEVGRPIAVSQVMTPRRVPPSLVAIAAAPQSPGRNRRQAYSISIRLLVEGRDRAGRCRAFCRG